MGGAAGRHYVDWLNDFVSYISSIIIYDDREWHRKGAEAGLRKISPRRQKKMLARITTHLPCSEAELWQKIVQPESLQFVASPFLSFVPVQDPALSSEWQVGIPYTLKLYFLKFIPVGLHTIEVAKIDKGTNTIVSRESGSLARVWNHTISFREVSPNLVTYTDVIEIRAGWLTPVIWLFAHLFYRHRQRRWKVLLRQNDLPRHAAT